jgi:hypothetical protein
MKTTAELRDEAKRMLDEAIAIAPLTTSEKRSLTWAALGGPEGERIMAECDRETIAKLLQRRKTGTLYFPTATGALLRMGDEGVRRGDFVVFKTCNVTVGVSTPSGPREVTGTLKSAWSDPDDALATAVVFVEKAEDRAALGLTMIAGWP